MERMRAALEAIMPFTESSSATQVDKVERPVLLRSRDILADAACKAVFPAEARASKLLA